MTDTFFADHPYVRDYVLKHEKVSTPMDESKVIAQQELAHTQYADLLEDGSVWIHENSAPAQDIKLDAAAATRLYDFLLLHMSRLQEIAQGQKVAEYNRQMDERNRIAVENREKPWLPPHDGE